MKNKLFKYYLLILFFIYSNAFSQNDQNWKWLWPQPQGNSISWVKIWNNNLWYAAGENGTFMKTTNAGINWTFNHKACDMPPNGNMPYLKDAIFTDQNTGYFAYDNGKLYKTTNAGTTFSRIISFPQVSSINDLHFESPDLIYAASLGTYALIFSTNGGNSWYTINTINSGASNVFTSGSTIILRVSSTVQKSTNLGLNWTTYFSTYIPVNNMFFTDINTGFISGEDGFFRYTTNGGLNWSGNNFSDHDFYYIYAENIISTDFSYNSVYTTTYAGKFFNTTNFGETWNEINFQDPFNLLRNIPHCIDKSQNLIIIAGQSALMNKSTNNGISWTAVTKLFSLNLFQDVWHNNNTGKMIACGFQSNPNKVSGIIYSTNAGADWNTSVNTWSDINSLSMIDDNTGYAGGVSSYGYPPFPVLRKTTNSGVSWDSISVLVQSGFYNIYHVDFIDVNTGYIFGNNSIIMRTSNGGNNWVLQYQLAGNQGEKSADMKDNIYGVYAAFNNIVLTTNSGINWIVQNVSNNVNWRAAKYTSNNTCYLAGDNHSGGPIAALYRTTNNGMSWSAVNVPFNYGIWSIDALDNNHIMVGSINGITAISSNGGQNWISEFTGSRAIRSIKMKTMDTAVIATYSGILKVTNGLSGNIYYSGTTVDNFVLYQNYPNPFNPVTKIKFILPKASNVKLIVYDISGRVVNQLIDNELNGGTFEITFNGSKLSTGIYFYSIYLNHERTETKKMLIVK